MPQPKRGEIRSKAAVELLANNIHNLEHPQGRIVHACFDSRFARDRDTIRETTRKLCEAIILLLENNDAPIEHKQ